MSHPDDSTIERFVMEGLEDDTAFVVHVGACEECSRKLERQAQIELALLEVGRRVAALPPAPVAEAQPAGAVRRERAESTSRSRAWRIVGPVTLFAAAAAVAVWAGRHARAPSVADLASAEATGGAAVAVVSCPDGPEQLACIAEAHRSGSRLEYPRGTAVAALGSEPGLTLAIEPSYSDGVLQEVDAFLARAPGDVKSCAARAILSEDAPIRTGHIGINVTILPGGGVLQSQAVLVLENGTKGRPLPDVDAPMATTDAVVARCMRQATQAFAFQGGGQPVRVSFIVKYVWRE